MGSIPTGSSIKKQSIGSTRDSGVRLGFPLNFNEQTIVGSVAYLKTLCKEDYYGLETS